MPALEVKRISKRFGPVLANDRVDFSLEKGEVHALLGENGAGKSTLVKAIYGLIQPDAGEIWIDEKRVDLKDSATAIQNGIGMVHQELMLIPYMTVAENVILGKEITKSKVLLDTVKANEEIKKLSDAYHFDLDPSVPVYKLPIGVQQRVEIVKLLYRHANILILDEPTALLTPQEAQKLFEVIRTLKNEGKSVIFITHKLQEVYEIADRMTIMRHGKVVAVRDTKTTDQKSLAELMVGKNVDEVIKEERPLKERIAVKVSDLIVKNNDGLPVVNKVSFEIHEGEILGVAGIEGNGQTQLAQALMGLLPTSGGSIFFDGQDITGITTDQIRKKGVGSIPDDRQGMGLILPFTIRENFMLNEFNNKPYKKGWYLQDWRAIEEKSDQLLKEFDVRAHGSRVPVTTLSGGNQQKVVVGRELSTKKKFLIVSQPTRGVDFASAMSIQRKIIDAADEGCAVLLISSDLEELLNTTDRIMVMVRGEIVGTIPTKAAQKEEIGLLMLGVNSQPSNTY